MKRAKKSKKPYSMRDLVRELCAREAGKAQVNIAQMGDVLHHLTNIVRERPIDVMNALCRRAARKA